MIATLLVSAIGCEEPPEIVRHRVLKSRSGLEDFRADNSSKHPTMPMAEQVETRMAVAIFEQSDAAWFFKVSGPVDQVDSTEKVWQEFIANVTFENGQPKWETPDSWSTSGPKPMRFATLLINDSKPPLELMISSLSAGQDLLLNVNRWRRQIGLSPATKDDLESQLKKLSSTAGDYLMFDQIGTGSGSMSPPFAGGAPFAGGMAPFAGGPSIATAELT